MNNINLNAVLDINNLLAAWEKVKENQGCGGIDHISLDDFEWDLQDKLETLKNEVHYGTYRPMPLMQIEIEKKSGGTRTLAIPTIRDRILQTAVALVLTPLFELEFEDISFAYRKGRSVDQAVARIEQYRNQGYRWVVDADIRACFDQIDHKRLMQCVSRLVKDKDILKLIRQWLNATIVDGKQRYKLRKGVPQGSPISPMLANLYLDQLDEILLDEHLRLVRFADDFVILCKNQKQARDALELTEDVLEKLRLSINEKKTRIVDFNTGFRFLGVQFIRSLAFKTKHHETFETDDTAQKTDNRIPLKPRRKKHKKKQPAIPDYFSLAVPRGEVATYTDEMQAAFLEAGISPKQFPSESDTPEPIEPPEPEEESPSESNHPRLKTLYLMKHGSTLGKEYERFTICYKGQKQQEIPAIHVDQIMVFGNSQITTQAMQFCLQQRIPIYLLSGKGRYYGVIDSFDTEPVLLHREQFQLADNPEFCLKLATQILTGKIANSRTIMQRTSRHRQAPACNEAATQLKHIQKQLNQAKDLNQLRGYEGTAARIYFQAIAATVDPKWQFYKRNKNPPKDPINAMLSYGYAILFYNIYSFLRSRGLNTHIGYLHPIRMGHPALASDMIEEFRSIIVDSVVLKMVLNDKISPDDFIIDKSSQTPCLLSNTARRAFTQQLENKMNSKLRHPNSQLKLDYRRCIEHQINHLVSIIRNPENDYQAMILR